MIMSVLFWKKSVSGNNIALYQDTSDRGRREARISRIMLFARWLSKFEASTGNEEQALT